MKEDIFLYAGVPTALGAALGYAGQSAGVKDMSPLSGGAGGSILGILLYIISALAKNKKKQKKGSIVLYSKSGIPVIINRERDIVQRKSKPELKSQLSEQAVLSRMLSSI